MKAPIGMIIKLTWRNFHIDNCKVSNLRIFDGFGPVNTPSPHTYCGLKKPPSYHSQGTVYAIFLYDKIARLRDIFALFFSNSTSG